MRRYLSDPKVLILIFLVLLRLNVSLWDYLNSRMEDLDYQLSYLNKIKQISFQKKKIEEFSKKFFAIDRKNCSSVLQVSSQSQFLSLAEERLYKLMKLYGFYRLGKVKWGTVSKSGNVYILPLRIRLEGNPKNLLELWCNLSRSFKSLEVKEFHLSFKSWEYSRKKQEAVLELSLVIYAVDNRFCLGEKVE